MLLDWGLLCPPGDIGQCRETLWLSLLRERYYWHPVDRSQGLPRTSQGTGQPLQQRLLRPTGQSAEAGDPRGGAWGSEEEAKPGRRLKQRPTDVGSVPRNGEQCRPHLGTVAGSGGAGRLSLLTVSLASVPRHLGL